MPTPDHVFRSRVKRPGSPGSRPPGTYAVSWPSTPSPRTTFPRAHLLAISVPHSMPKSRSYDDCVAALERGLRDAALQIVKVVFDAELARLEDRLRGGTPAAPPAATAERARLRQRTGE